MPQDQLTLLDKALAFTLGNEGGYSNNPVDPGGATNFGIIQRTLDRWNGIHPELGFPANVRTLTQAQAELIYRLDYWRWDDLTAPAVAIKLFDIGVNAGLATAVKLLQKAVNTLVNPPPLAVDGQLGPMTLAAANAQTPSALLEAICEVQADYYNAIVARNPSQAAFIKGWLKRAAMKPEV